MKKYTFICKSEEAARAFIEGVEFVADSSLEVDYNASNDNIVVLYERRDDDNCEEVTLHV